MNITSNKMRIELTKLELKEDYVPIPFEWRTDEAGTAEFVLFPIITNGRMTQVKMSPYQQPNAKHYYVINNDEGWEGISFGHLLVGNKLNFPNVWKTDLYKDGMHSIRMYVPHEAKSFFIRTALGNFCIYWQ